MSLVAVLPGSNDAVHVVEAMQVAPACAVKSKQKLSDSPGASAGNGATATTNAGPSVVTVFSLAVERLVPCHLPNH